MRRSRFGRAAAAVTAVALPRAEALRRWTIEKAGLTLGIGLGAAKPADALRIAHMGHVNAAMVTATLSAVDMALKALGVPHGAGAMDAALALLADRTKEAG